MKKRVITFFCLLSMILIDFHAFADSRTTQGLSETEQLGISAGVALACKVDSEQLENYEMIASRIISNPLSSEAAEKKALRLYAEAKLKAFKEQKQKGIMNCVDVIERFENQEIFKSVVYRDGTLKMPNGKVVKPKRPLKVKKKKNK